VSEPQNLAHIPTLRWPGCVCGECLKAHLALDFEIVPMVKDGEVAGGDLADLEFDCEMAGCDLADLGWPYDMQEGDEPW